MSEDIDELYSISDRICAICDGELSPVAPTHDVSINQLGMWMAGDFHAVNNDSSVTASPTYKGDIKSC